jgi:hypothetical protein
MQTDSFESLLEKAKQESQELLNQFKKMVAEGEDVAAKERIEAFEKDILARQESCMQEFDSEIARLAQLKQKNPKRAELYVNAEQSARRQCLSSMTFLRSVLRDSIAQY